MGKKLIFEIPSHLTQSIANTGSLTISVWMSPETLDFLSIEDKIIIHWVDKGD
jgi:hypothetical protein